MSRKVGKWGMGGTYQRDGTWWIRYSNHGRKVRESSHSEKEADANKLLKLRLGQLGLGRLPGHEAERVTLKDLSDMVANDYKRQGRKTGPRAAQAFRQVCGYFSEAKRALSVTYDALDAYVAKRMEDGAAMATISLELTILKRGYNLAIKAKRLPERPAFPTITLNNARKGFFEEAEFRAVLAGLPPEAQPVAEFLYWTGWRSSEALAMEWRNVDMAAGIARRDVGTTKNQDGRTLPFHALPELAAVLKAQRERTSELERTTGQIVPWVFHRHGKRIMGFRKSWVTACVAAGLGHEDRDDAGRLVKKIAHRTPHDFRRTAVRNMERFGVSRSVAMKVTGHKTESVYRRYAIVSESDIAEGLGKVAAATAGPAQPSKVTRIRKTGTGRAQRG